MVIKQSEGTWSIPEPQPGGWRAGLGGMPTDQKGELRDVAGALTWPCSSGLRAKGGPETRHSQVPRGDGSPAGLGYPTEEQ